MGELHAAIGDRVSAMVPEMDRDVTGLPMISAEEPVENQDGTHNVSQRQQQKPCRADCGIVTQ